MSEPAEVVKGMVSCACSKDEWPGNHLMLLFPEKDPTDPWQSAEFDAAEYLKGLFAEHLGERFEIRFFKEGSQ